MNKCYFIGRLTRDPEVRVSTDGKMQIARYSIAVDRRGKDGGTDFLNCVAFDKGAEFAEKYLNKGIKIAVNAHVQTGSYKNREGQTVYTTDFVVDETEFVESKQRTEPTPPTPKPKPADEFMDYEEDGELPFI